MLSLTFSDSLKINRKKTLLTLLIICKEVLYLNMSNDKKQIKMETINDILDSKEFNEMFDFETEQKEIKEAGWTYEEIQKFGQELSKKIEK